jgi:uncharacterized repeat protein (TIGR01451 family)
MISFFSVLVPAHIINQLTLYRNLFNRSPCWADISGSSAERLRYSAGVRLSISRAIHRQPINGAFMIIRIVWYAVVSALLTGMVTVASADPWTTYQGNASHSGYVPVTLDPNEFTLRWQRTIGSGSMQLNPVASGDGKVFVTESGYFSNQGLYALSAVDGALLWNLNYGSVRSVNPPAYSSGTVYIQTVNHSTDTYLRAYNAATGSLAFQASHAAQWEQYYAPTVFADTVYVDGGYYGGMYAFDSVTGSQRWYASLNQYDQWTPAVDNTYAYAYIGDSCSGCANAGLTAIDRLTGANVFTIGDTGFVWNGWSMDQAPVLGDQNDVLVINGGRLISFDLTNRIVRWQISGGFANQPSVAKGAIYAIANGALTVRDETTGTQLWAWGTPSGSLTGPVIVTDSHAFVRTATSVYAVGLATRTAVWSYPASGHMALADGTLYIAGVAGSLTAISAAASTSDISVALVNNPDPAWRKKPLTYTATVSNLGPTSATQITLSIKLPSDMAVVSISAGCTMTNSQVTCTYPSLAYGSKISAAAVVIPLKHGTYSATASVTAYEHDPIVGNNSASLTTRIR